MAPTKTEQIYGTNNQSEKWLPLNSRATNPMGVPGDKFCSINRSDDKVHDKKDEPSDSRQSLKVRVYFTEFTTGKAFGYFLASLFVVACGIASFVELLLDLPCPEEHEIVKYPNPAYDGSQCPHIRQSFLLFLTPTECSFGRRLVSSILMGGLIGWERRQADRPAGIRTMSLVSLGSCLFTINSAFAFRSGPMDWDASRISAAIPSGVGFLGAGLIFKKTGDDQMVVHGLTTAASVWLSAAVGIACGGELYFAALFGTCLMMLLLRFGPRGSDAIEDDEESDDDEEDADDFYDTMSKLELPRRDGGQPVLVSMSGNEGEIDGRPGVDILAFRSNDGGYNVPGMHLTQIGYMDGRSIATRSNLDLNTIDGDNCTTTGDSTDNNNTTIGDSTENHSIVTELTPMLGSQQSDQQQQVPPISPPRQLPPLSPPRHQLRSLSPPRHQLSPRSIDLQSRRLTVRRTNKSNRTRKRKNVAKLGSIV